MPQAIYSALDLYIAFRAQRGRHLLSAGGLGDQSAALMDIFGLLDRLWSEDAP